MDVELTPERQARLADAGYVLAPALDPPPVRGRARVHDSTGRPFDLELVELPDGAREAHIAHLSGWFPVADPGVEHLVDALDLDDAVGYLTAVSGACTLEAFVEATGRLGAGHTSTVLVTLGRTLARLHAHGLRYGPIRPRDVLVDAGRVLLTVPRPPLTGAAPMAPSPQEDAYHLAALADAVIAPAHGPEAGDRPEPGLRGLSNLIVSALGDADTRPGVGTLATLSHDLAPCLPLVHRSAAVPGAGDGEAPGAATSPSAWTARPATLPVTLPATLPDGARRAGLDRPPPRRKAFAGSASRRDGAGRRSVDQPGGTAGAGDRGDGLGELRAPVRGAGVVRTPTGRRRPPRLAVVALVGVLAGLVGGGVVVHRLGGDAAAQAVVVGDAAPTSSAGEAPAEAGPARTPAEEGGKASEPEGIEQALGDPGVAAAQLTAARMDAVVALTNAPEVAPAAASEAGSAVPGADTVGDDGADRWSEVLVPDSPAHAQATALVASLRADEARISGLAVQTEGVVVREQVAASASAPATAQVEVTFTIGAYTLESPAGAQTVPAGAPRTAILDLVATGSGWRVATVHEVAADG